MKNHDINNKPVLILVLAAIFLGGGLAGFIDVFYSDYEYRTLFLALTPVLIVVGVIFVVYGTLRLVKLNTAKKIKNDPNAHVTDATFVKANLSSFSSASVGNGLFAIPVSINAYKKITYEYVDETGEKHVTKSNVSYFPKQIEYLQQKGTFKIKCQGKESVIIEEIPESKSLYNL